MLPRKKRTMQGVSGRIWKILQHRWSDRKGCFNASRLRFIRWSYVESLTSDPELLLSMQEFALQRMPDLDDLAIFLLNFQLWRSANRIWLERSVHGPNPVLKLRMIRQEFVYFFLSIDWQKDHFGHLHGCNFVRDDSRRRQRRFVGASITEWHKHKRDGKYLKQFNHI